MGYTAAGATWPHTGIHCDSMSTIGSLVVMEYCLLLKSMNIFVNYTLLRAGKGQPRGEAGKGKGEGGHLTLSSKAML